MSSTPPPHMESPFNALPAVVVALALALFGVEAVLQLGERGLVGGPEAVGWRTMWAQRLAVTPDVFDLFLSYRLPLSDVLLRLFGYSFVHASFTHMLFVVIFVLALGKMVGEIFASWAVLAVFFGSAVMGGVIFGTLIDGRAILFGGYPGAYGLIGAFTFLLWVQLAATGGPQARAFYLIGFLMGIQLIFGLLFGGGLDWVADIAGFATGFLLSFVVSPGGWSRVMAKLRQR
ncbi:rhomboid family intramembrane serine protease [Psychromarinibacter sp. C21-152]|uniref:Rhomboid family intramembrane serine protease n=1 Tax=Psychromarinibacter sediminicola TaxID=3033385 RepID=A0AAE3NY13_9RHOB|nr:rhomboid family intramembrane serine protease [Psychromarinibacter sediminicola]MDF0603045.1 rhomboid family intramembrane serine protease [Psychromarinibacter sediminicola]